MWGVLVSTFKKIIFRTIGQPIFSEYIGECEILRVNGLILLKTG